MRALARAGACVLSLGLLIPAVNADTITFPFTGTGSQGSTNYEFQINGNDFFLSIGSGEGPFNVALCPTPGSPCPFQVGYRVGVLPPTEMIPSTAILDGIETHVNTGTLIFTGTLTPPTALGDFSTTVPVSFTGNIVGHAANDNFPVLFTVLLNGSGTADLSGFVDQSVGIIVNRAQYTFSGTATAETVPEPATVALTIGGLGLLGMLVRRRRATQV